MSASLIGQGRTRTYHELQPMFSLAEFWQLGILALVAIVIAAFVIWMYRRDAVELPRGIATLLLSLRLLAFVGILVFVLNPGRRTESRLVKTSRLAVLVDTSLSMGLRDSNGGSANEGFNSPTDGRVRRIDEVLNTLEGESVFQQLRQEHDLTFYRFGEQSQPTVVATLEKAGSDDDDLAPLTSSAVLANELAQAKRIGIAAVLVALVALTMLIGWLIKGLAKSKTKQSNSFADSDLVGRPPDARSWILAFAVWGIVVAVGLLAWADLTVPRCDLWTSLGWQRLPNSVRSDGGFGPEESASESDVTAESQRNDAANSTSVANADAESIEWAEEFAPRDTSTKIGAAVQYIVNKERGGPIAGIVLITDGRSNGGTEPSRAIAGASNAGIPIFPIGIGSSEAPKNVQVTDIQAPPRVFPGDKFAVKGLVSATGLEGQTVMVSLASIDEQETEAELLEAETAVRLPADNQQVSVAFDVQRQAQGKRRYIIRVAELEGDLDQGDNQRGATVEIVQRKTRILMMAGGPTREFRFLRNQLFRDKDVNLDVWLQSAKEGADQESDQLLFDFPVTREGLFQYDCLIAFDPDWRDLSEQQAQNLERWVAEKAGGMLVVAGPVNTPEWTRRPRGDKAMDFLRKLYPVAFYNQGSSVLKLGRFGGEEAFPLEFSREGRAAEYLWLGDTPADSAETWGQFRGVFGYYAVNEPKPGADVLANFADPSTSIDDRMPIYLASHFYGAGRVFFQASGEMWRVRNIDVDYFETYYNKIIRWLSQGRLLRDSTRGVLLTDRDRCWMGDQVSVQAILRDAQDEPYVAASVDATLLRPDGVTEKIPLRASKDAVRAGTFDNQFSAGLEGEYRISLPVPESPELDVLIASIQVNIPDLEKERPQRNDPLLAQFAEQTRGQMYVGMDAFTADTTIPASPLNLIAAQDQETFIPGAPDRFFQRRVMMWLLGMITLLLCLEWTIRRLQKLA